MARALLLLAALAATIQATKFTIAITHTNDFHGYLLPTVSSNINNGGAQRMLFCEKYQHSLADESLALDAGDLTLAGQPIGYLVNGSSAVDFFNLRGLRATAVGNHDFDKGQENLIQRIAESNFTWLGANVIVEGSTNWTHPWYLSPYVVVTMPRSGARIGIIGITVPFCKKITLARNTVGLDFTDGTLAVAHYYPEVKAQSDIVVVLAHIGKTLYTTGGVTYDGTQQIATKLNTLNVSVDLLVSGHDHQIMVYTKYGNSLVVDGDCNNRRLGIAKLTYDNTTRTGTWSTTLLVLNNATGSTDCPLGLDADGLALVRKWESKLSSRLQLFLANTTVALKKSTNWCGESNLGKLVTDSFRYWGDLTDDGVLNNSTDVSFQNNGGIRTNIPLDTGLTYHRLIWNDMATTLPMSNNMVILNINGKQMRQICEAMMGYFDVSSSGLYIEYWKRTLTNGTTQLILDKCKINGKLLNESESATYRVSTSNYVAEGGGGMSWLVNGTNIVYYNDLDMDAVTTYFLAKFANRSVLTSSSYPDNRAYDKVWVDPVSSSSVVAPASSSVKPVSSSVHASSASAAVSSAPLPSASSEAPKISSSTQQQSVLSSAEDSSDVFSICSSESSEVSSAKPIPSESASASPSALSSTPGSLVVSSTPAPSAISGSKGFSSSGLASSYLSDDVSRAAWAHVAPVLCSLLSVVLAFL